VNNLLNEFQHNFEKMAEHLKIMNAKMVLINPNFKSNQPIEKTEPPPISSNPYSNQDSNMVKTPEDGGLGTSN